MSWFRPRPHIPPSLLLRLIGEIVVTLQDLQAAQAVTNQKLDELANRIASIPAAPDLQSALDAEVALQNKIDAILPATPAPTV